MPEKLRPQFLHRYLAALQGCACKYSIGSKNDTAWIRAVSTEIRFSLKLQKLAAVAAVPPNIGGLRITSN